VLYLVYNCVSKLRVFEVVSKTVCIDEIGMGSFELGVGEGFAVFVLTGLEDIHMASVEPAKVSAEYFGFDFW
jgi:hypothetical protein